MFGNILDIDYIERKMFPYEKIHPITTSNPYYNDCNASPIWQFLDRF